MSRSYPQDPCQCATELEVETMTVNGLFSNVTKHAPSSHHQSPSLFLWQLPPPTTTILTTTMMSDSDPYDPRAK